MQRDYRRDLIQLFGRVAIFFLMLSLTNGYWLPAARAHGDEDHGAQAQPAPPTPQAGEINIKLAKTSTLEVMMKYPTPIINNETLLRIFITDIKTNAPVAGANIALVLNYLGKNQPGTSNNNAQQVTAAPTDKAGIYQAKVTFSEAGPYNIALKLKGTNIDAQALISGVMVVDAAKQTVAAPPQLKAFVIISTIIIFILFLIGLYLLRNRQEQQPSSHRSEQALL